MRVFDEALASGGRVKAIVAPGMGGATRREIDELTQRAKRFGAKGLAHLSIEVGGGVQGTHRQVPLAEGGDRGSRSEPPRTRATSSSWSRTCPTSPPMSSGGCVPSSASGSASLTRRC